MEIGFSVSCCRHDLPFARACVASIRYFAPDARILLVADGDFNCEDMERAYGVEVLRRRDVKHDGLREFSFGFGITKMVAFWEAPFDIVFHVDADAVLWGDVRKNLPVGNWDVVFNEPHEVIDDYTQRTQYFDPKRIFEFVSEFPWQGNPYFQAGVICVRRGCLDLDRYIEMLKLQRQHPDVFVNGDQGMLNLLVFRAAHEGKLTAKPAHLQTVVPVIPMEELRKRFCFKDGKPLVIGRPTVVHWAGVKPWRWNRGCYSAPMDYFRGRAGAELRPMVGRFRELSMLLDEWQAQHYPRWLNKVKTAVKSVLKNARLRR